MLSKNQILTLFFLILIPTTLEAQAWLTGFNFRRKITINKSKVSAKVTADFPSPVVYSNQIDVPVLIEVIDKDLIFGNGACGNRIQDPEGRDISFSLATAPTVPLNFQLEEYDPLTGRLTCWVKISSLSANRTTTAATEIYFYYGGTVIHNSKSVTALQTWNSDYTKVWHMNAISPASGIHQMNLPLSGTGTAFTEGKVAKSSAFDGISTFYTGGSEINNSITVSAWIKMNSFGTEQMIITNDSSGMGGFQVKVNAAGKLVVQTFNSLSAPTITVSTVTMREAGKWYHVWGTLATGDIKLFIDNVSAASSASSAIRIGPGGRINIGSSKQNGQFFNGQIDELRLQKTPVSKEWMSTCYENQNDPKSFYTVGVEEFSPGGFSRFIGTNTQWNLSGNWTGNLVPQANANILIPAGKKVISSGNTIFKSLIVEPGGTLELGSDLKFTCLVDIANGGIVKVSEGASMRLGGNIQNDGQITSSGVTAKVIFEGLGLVQEYDGTGSASISVLENNQSNPSNILLFSAPIEVSGFLNLKEGVLQSRRTLVLKATSQTATASLLPVDPLLASVIGDVIVEQYISGVYPVPATARGWRLLSSPVYTSDITGTKSYNSRSFKAEIFVTGNGGVTNGFDTSPLNGATIYTHDQSLPGTLSQKYVGIKSIDQNIEIGKGVYIFSRGSRHVLNAFVNQIQMQPFINPQPYTIKHVGKLFVGELSVSLASKDMGNVGDGFNLIGNPYASNLRWGDITTDKTTRFIWQFDPLNAAYIVDDSPNVIIPPGTGFFVRLAAGEKSGKLIISERSKFTSSAPSLPVLQTTRTSNTPAAKNAGALKIILSKSTFEQAYVLKLTEQGFDGINDLDALKIGEGHVSISSLVNQEQLSIDNRQSTNETKVVSLNVTGTESGSYKLLFNASLDKKFHIKLVDTYLNTEKQIKATDNTYLFTMDKTATGSAGNLRFKVLIDPVTGIDPIEAGIKVYPNPFTENISIQFSKNLEESLEVIITDILGKVVFKTHIEIGATLVPINTQAFGKGFYLLQLINSNRRTVLTTLKLIKS